MGLVKQSIEQLNRIDIQSVFDALTYTIRKPLAESKWLMNGKRRRGLSRFAALVKNILPDTAFWRKHWFSPNVVLASP